MAITVMTNLRVSAGADQFNCGAGTDAITDFDATQGDTKTADCESF